MDSEVPQIIIMVVCLLVAAFLSLSETSLTMLSKIRLRNMLDEGEKGAAAIEKATRDPKRLLSTILIGQNVSNILLASIATTLALSLIPGEGTGVIVALVTVAVTLTLLIFCDVFPKTLAAANPKRFSKVTAPIINLFILVCTPFVFLLNSLVAMPIKLLADKGNDPDVSLTESEIKTIVDIGQEEGVIQHEEHRLISNVFEFSDLKAKEVMVPRTDMAAVPIDASFDEVMEKFKSEQFHALPVYKENTDNIAGILYLHDLFFLEQSEQGGDFIEMNMRPPMFSYENKPLNELFREMHTNKAQMAVIVDEYGGTSGILTIGDLINEIAGGMPPGEEDEIITAGECEYIAAGDARLEDVNEALDINLESDDCETIGGYVLGLLDDMPEQNAEAAENGIRYIVEELEKNRIIKVRIIKNDTEGCQNEKARP